ncbi:MAG TPA: Nramp family divalent metal transporter [Candidatus Dormibacteraeota bacterium]|nr:Nramp family divalent metal transporter [Candidatus Dormibacteraeota bacterium]
MPAPQSKEPWHRRLLSFVGPGFITGASDDDPSGIATLAQSGAQYGYGLLWTTSFAVPLMIGIQEACARIGLVTGRGIAAMIRKRYGTRAVVVVAILLAVANTINLAADIGAMAAALRLLVPVPKAVAAAAFALGVLALEVFVGYERYAWILKGLALSLLTYPIVAAISKVPWGTVLAATVVPHVSLDGGFVFLLTAILGTTISPYLFFWEAAEEVEEVKEIKRKRGGRWSRRQVARRMRIDNAFGMIVSNLIGWFILVVSATVLHQQGVQKIRTAADAARALEPLVSSFPHAGTIAGGIFALGIIGLGALAVPVLAGSASYAFADAFGWRAGLDRNVREAPGFYAVIALAVLIGLAIDFTGLDPIGLLVWTAVINGFVAVPLVFIIGRIAADRKLMGEHASGWLSRAVVPLTGVLMGISAVATVIGLLHR